MKWENPWSKQLPNIDEIAERDAEGVADLLPMSFDPKNPRDHLPIHEHDISDEELQRLKDEGIEGDYYLDPKVDDEES